MVLVHKIIFAATAMHCCYVTNKYAADGNVPNLFCKEKMYWK